MASRFTGNRIAGGIGTARGFIDNGGQVSIADIDQAALSRAEEILGRVRLAPDG